jgi:hypothetical protein
MTFQNITAVNNFFLCLGDVACAIRHIFIHTLDEEKTFPNVGRVICQPDQSVKVEYEEKKKPTRCDS